MEDVVITHKSATVNAKAEPEMKLGEMETPMIVGRFKQNGQVAPEVPQAQDESNMEAPQIISRNRQNQSEIQKIASGLPKTKSHYEGEVLDSNANLYDRDIVNHQAYKNDDFFKIDNNFEAIENQLISQYIKSITTTQVTKSTVVNKTMNNVNIPSPQINNKVPVPQTVDVPTPHHIEEPQKPIKAAYEPHYTIEDSPMDNQAPQMPAMPMPQQMQMPAMPQQMPQQQMPAMPQPSGNGDIHTGNVIIKQPDGTTSSPSPAKSSGSDNKSGYVNKILII